jgi:hypothetical protein
MEDAGKRAQDFLIAAQRRDANNGRPASLHSLVIDQRNHPGGIAMLRTSVCVAAVLLVAASLHTASAQTAAPATTPTPTAKPSKMKLTADRLKEMRAKWSANKGKLAACRKEVKSKGLAGDDRWFYIEDCMDKT